MKMIYLARPTLILSLIFFVLTIFNFNPLNILNVLNISLFFITTPLVAIFGFSYLTKKLIEASESKIWLLIKTCLLSFSVWVLLSFFPMLKLSDYMTNMRNFEVGIIWYLYGALIIISFSVSIINLAVKFKPEKG